MPTKGKDGSTTAVAKSDKTKKVTRRFDEVPKEWVAQSRQYLREVVSELRKVVWPSRKETLGSTVVVLVIVVISGIFLGLVDHILGSIVSLVLG